MPEGILIIDWDEFEGGFISFKYPDLAVPDNLVQLLQISHSFNPGMITIQEEGFHALSIGNEALQKVIVLILTPYEDASDFNEIMFALNRVVSQYSESEELLEEELVKMYGLSQSVFKAREAVMNKLTSEVTNLKNKELDYRRSLKWLYQHESDPQKKILIFILHKGSVFLSKLHDQFDAFYDDLDKILHDMEDGGIIEIKNNRVHSLVHYLVK